MEIVNRVKNSGLVTVDLENFLPIDSAWTSIDIKDQLWQGMVLKEKDFRNFIKNEDWSKYKNKAVYVFCSEDAIVPPWAYMLIASALFDYASFVTFGSSEKATENYVMQQIANIDVTKYKDARLVIKGCAKIPNVEGVFTALTMKLRGVAKTIMYGEPCSTVPIYKAPKPAK
jgi:hypothetical protein